MRRDNVGLIKAVVCVLSVRLSCCNLCKNCGSVAGSYALVLNLLGSKSHYLPAAHACLLPGAVRL